MQLLIVDTTGIQGYIFGSNRLRENVGASYLVSMATDTWAKELLFKVTKSQCNLVKNTWQRNEGTMDNGCKGEEIYSGGGNFAALFDNAALAEEFSRALSLRVLLEAPGLRLIIEHCAFDATRSGDLKRAFDQVFEQIRKAKRSGSVSNPLLGLGVTMDCASSGLPAVELIKFKNQRIPVSAEVLAKFQAATPQTAHDSRADLRLQKFVQFPDDEDAYAFPRELDDFEPTKGEFSYIAVVHIDGNDIGERFREIQNIQTDADTWRSQIENLRTLSGTLSLAGTGSLEHILSLLTPVNGSKTLRHPERPDIELEYAADNDRIYLPFRPIVFGGDDITFVCNGRLGIGLAVEFLRKYEKQESEISGKLSACAGIAIVKTHYPFARAYALAEQLCQNAKAYRREQNGSGCYLDWHFAQSGLAGNIETIRRREFDLPGKRSLCLRPVSLSGQTGRSWEVVRKGIEAFQSDRWYKRRNKIKSLREVLRKGPDEVEWFRTKFLDHDRLPSIEDNNRHSSWPESGWHGNLCGYFDAIELMDWYIPLHAEENNETAPEA